MLGVFTVSVMSGVFLGYILFLLPVVLVLEVGLYLDAPPHNRDGTYETNGTYVTRWPSCRARARLSWGAPTCL
jgi:hypothetical protein